MLFFLKPHFYAFRKLDNQKHFFIPGHESFTIIQLRRPSGPLGGEFQFSNLQFRRILEDDQ